MENGYAINKTPPLKFMRVHLKLQKSEELFAEEQG